MSEASIFENHIDENSLKIAFGSSMDNIDRTGSMVKKFMNKPALRKYSFPVRVVMREGLTNAVRHGNKHDPAKLVYFSLYAKKNEIMMEIEDHGEGFDWKGIIKKNQLNQEKMNSSDHGRGVPILNHYVDKFWYNESGTKLTIVMNISA